MKKRRSNFEHLWSVYIWTVRHTANWFCHKYAKSSDTLWSVVNCSVYAVLLLL